MAVVLTSFPLFTALPTELRSKIWEYCLPEPRIVEVFIKGHLLPRVRDKNLYADPLSSSEPTSPILRRLPEPQPESRELAEEEETPESSNRQAPIYITSSPLPTPLLHTCHESRELAQKRYTLSFGTAFFPPRVYFNSALDTLYLPYWSFTDGSAEFVSYTDPAGPLVVQHVAFDLDKWYSSWEDEHLNYQIEPMKWPSLKSVTFLLSEPHPEGRCSCCEKPERPEVLGGVSFVDLKGDERVWAGKCLEDCEQALLEMREGCPSWKGPEVRAMALVRDGKRV
jgi:hypothetical protein